MGPHNLSNFSSGCFFKEAPILGWKLDWNLPKEISEVVQNKSLVYSSGFLSVAFLYLMADKLLLYINGDRTGPVMSFTITCI